jgi:hypothetical protein
MGLSLQGRVLRARLRAYASGRERLLIALRMLRYGMLQGPWQEWLVRHHQRHGLNPPLPCDSETLFDRLDVPSSVHLLLTRGWGGAFVAPRSIVEEIASYARTLRERGIKRSDDPHLFCDGASRLAHDPRIVGVAREFLGAEPILCASNLYWTIPPSDAEGQRAAAAEGGRFHYDMIDVRALTVFVYLTDVDEQCGPHVVIEGTQGPKRSFRKFDRFLPDHEVERRYSDRIRIITGARGTGWFEDITCYHRQEAAQCVRLMISINYSLHRPPLARERLAPAHGVPPPTPAERPRL